MNAFICTLRKPARKRADIGRWMTFHYHKRPHTVHGVQPPAVAYFNSIETDEQAQAEA